MVARVHRGGRHCSGGAVARMLAYNQRIESNIYKNKTKAQKLSSSLAPTIVIIMLKYAERGVARLCAERRLARRPVRNLIKRKSEQNMYISNNNFTAFASISVSICRW